MLPLLLYYLLFSLMLQCQSQQCRKQNNMLYCQICSNYNLLEMFSHAMTPISFEEAPLGDFLSSHMKTGYFTLNWLSKTNNCDQILDLKLVISFFHLCAFGNFLTIAGNDSSGFIHISSVSVFLSLSFPLTRVSSW